MSELMAGQVVRIKLDAWERHGNLPLVDDYRGKAGQLGGTPTDRGTWLCVMEDRSLGYCEVSPDDVQVVAPGLLRTLNI